MENYHFVVKNNRKLYSILLNKKRKQNKIISYNYYKMIINYNNTYQFEWYDSNLITDNSIIKTFIWKNLFFKMNLIHLSSLSFDEVFIFRNLKKKYHEFDFTKLWLNFLKLSREREGERERKRRERENYT